MINILFVIVVFSSFFWFNGAESCIIIDDKMDCSNMQMLDCPPVNVLINILIMDNNRLTNISGNCSKWSLLYEFSLSNNKVVGPLDLSSFLHLSKINARHNQITKASFANHLDIIDLSYNSLTKLNLNGGKFLTSLILGHNTLNNDAVNDLIYTGLIPNIVTLDFSFNNLHEVPSNFQNFNIQGLTSINLSGNFISSIDFGSFSNTMKIKIKLNISFNLVTSFVINETPSIYFLDLSHNRISTIDNNTLSRLFQIPKVDLSHNPFNCSCDFKPYFVASMNEHNNTFVNHSSTNCNLSKGPNIFNMVCHNVSSQSSTWWIYVIVAVTIFVLISLVLYGVYRRRRSGYTYIGDSASIFIPSSWIFMDCLRSSNVNVEAAVKSEVSFSDQQIHFQDKLIVLCTSKNTKWILKEIVPNLNIDTEVIDFTCRKAPTASFILIVLNGDSDMNDSKLKKNVTLLTERRNGADLKVLLRSIPNADTLKKNTVLSRYLNEAILNNSYFLFDAEYPLSCIDSLRAWLNFNVSRDQYPCNV